MRSGLFRLLGPRLRPRFTAGTWPQLAAIARLDCGAVLSGANWSTNGLSSRTESLRQDTCARCHEGHATCLPARSMMCPRTARCSHVEPAGRDTNDLAAVTSIFSGRASAGLLWKPRDWHTGVWQWCCRNPNAAGNAVERRRFGDGLWAEQRGVVASAHGLSADWDVARRTGGLRPLCKS